MTTIIDIDETEAKTIMEADAKASATGNTRVEETVPDDLAVGGEEEKPNKRLKRNRQNTPLVNPGTKPRNSGVFSPSFKVTALTEVNPWREGAKAHKIYAVIAGKGGTIADILAACKARGIPSPINSYIVWFSDRKVIEVVPPDESATAPLMHAALEQLEQIEEIETA